MDGPRMLVIPFWNSPLKQVDENRSSQADKKSSSNVNGCQRKRENKENVIVPLQLKQHSLIVCKSRDGASISEKFQKEELREIQSMTRIIKSTEHWR